MLQLATIQAGEPRGFSNQAEEGDIDPGFFMPEPAKQRPLSGTRRRPDSATKRATAPLLSLPSSVALEASAAARREMQFAMGRDDSLYGPQARNTKKQDEAALRVATRNALRQRPPGRSESQYPKLSKTLKIRPKSEKSLLRGSLG